MRRFLKDNSEKYYGVDENGHGCDSVKWYEWKEDMIAMSRMFPGVLFKMHGEGEENGDMWDAYFLDGKVQVHKARIVIDPLDPHAWQTK